MLHRSLNELISKGQLTLAEPLQSLSTWTLTWWILKLNGVFCCMKGVWLSRPGPQLSAAVLVKLSRTPLPAARHSNQDLQRTGGELFNACVLTGAAEQNKHYCWQLQNKIEESSLTRVNQLNDTVGNTSKPTGPSSSWEKHDKDQLCSWHKPL